MKLTQRQIKNIIREMLDADSASEVEAVEGVWSGDAEGEEQLDAHPQPAQRLTLRAEQPGAEGCTGAGHGPHSARSGPPRPAVPTRAPKG